MSIMTPKGKKANGRFDLLGADDSFVPFSVLEIPLQETAQNPAAPLTAPQPIPVHCRIHGRLLYKHAGGTAYGKLVVQRERWERLERVFAQALDWPAEERPERLARACGDDA